MELREVTYLAVALRIVVATIFGAVIGLERGLKNRPAGLRTYMLVCLGACVIMLTNQYLFQVTQTGDPMRLGAQVVSGIGFLGAGTIIVTKHNQIKGLTTAAGLWTCAGVGLALGVGFYEAALAAGLSMVFILSIMQRWDNKMRRKTRFLELYIEISNALSLGELIRWFREEGAEVSNVQLERDNAPEKGVRGVIADLKTTKRFDHVELLDKLRTLEGVIYLEEL